MSDRTFNGVKVFAATMFQDRADLGDKVTAWLAKHERYQIADVIVTQSSDHQFHCISISIFYRDPDRVARVLPAPRKAS